LLPLELFTAAERTHGVLKATDAPCCGWKPSDRYSTLQQYKSTVAAEVSAAAVDGGVPCSVFEIQGLDVKTSNEAVTLLDGLDIFVGINVRTLPC
jgi:hypothetical protein